MLRFRRGGRKKGRGGLEGLEGLKRGQRLKKGVRKVNKEVRGVEGAYRAAWVARGRPRVCGAGYAPHR